MGRFAIIMGFMLLLTVVTEAEYMKYKDPKQKLGVRIKDLMKRMTLEEKIGQMTQIERKVASAEVMKKYFIGMFEIFFTLLIYKLAILEIFAHLIFENCVIRTLQKCQRMLIRFSEIVQF